MFGVYHSHFCITDLQCLGMIMMRTAIFTIAGDNSQPQWLVHILLYHLNNIACRTFHSFDINAQVALVQSKLQPLFIYFVYYNFILYTASFCFLPFILIYDHILKVLCKFSVTYLITRQASALQPCLYALYGLLVSEIHIKCTK